jgi:hypothetical protein
MIMTNVQTKEKIAAEILTLWNIDDAAERSMKAEQWTVSDFRYADPHKPSPATSRSEFLDYLSGFRSALPDAAVALTGQPSLHSGYALLQFEVTRAGQFYSKGQFFLRFSEDDMLTEMVGFLDE